MELTAFCWLSEILNEELYDWKSWLVWRCHLLESALVCLERNYDSRIEQPFPFSLWIQEFLWADLQCSFTWWCSKCSCDSNKYVNIPFAFQCNKSSIAKLKSANLRKAIEEASTKWIRFRVWSIWHFCVTNYTIATRCHQFWIYLRWWFAYSSQNDWILQITRPSDWRLFCSCQFWESAWALSDKWIRWGNWPPLNLMNCTQRARDTCCLELLDLLRFWEALRAWPSNYLEVGNFSWGNSCNRTSSDYAPSR